jgi:hypothetical protein
MAQRSAVVKGGQGFSYQGLNRSEDGNFNLNGYDVYIKVIDQNGTAFGASEDFQTDLKKVHAAKIINVTDETGNARTDLTVTLGANGLVTVADLNGLNSSDVVVLIAVGSRN